MIVNIDCFMLVTWDTRGGDETYTIESCKLSMPVKQGIDILLLLLSLLLLLLHKTLFLPSCNSRTTIAPGLKLCTLMGPVPRV